MKDAAEIDVPLRLATMVRSRAADYFELTKPRLTLLAVAMAMLGFYVGADGPMPVVLTLATLLGIGLVGASAAALNQFLERDADARMRRTENRPLPAMRLQPPEALLFGTICAAVGVLVLTALVNPLTGLLGVICLASYLFLYTPLKRRTPWCTLVGALPGAIPPLMGWTAARNQLDAGGWLLFLIVFFWQMPHFLAIAWLYQNDYERGRFRVLPVVEPDGKRTARQIAFYSSVLLPVSLAPTFFGLTGNVYLVGALLAGVAFIALGLRFAANMSKEQARWLFLGSVAYLPAIGILMVFSKP
jgi:protoheme IX farnesyltransferase